MAAPAGMYPQASPAGPPIAVPMSRVELSVAARNLRDMDALSKSDPVCVLFMKEPGQETFFEVGRTEIIQDSLNPEWVKKFEVDYRFEERQVLRFSVYDWDTKSTRLDDQDQLGSAECSLGEVMASQGTEFSRSLSKGGMIIVSGEEMSNSKEVATMQFSAKDVDNKDFLGKSDPFLIFYRCQLDNTYVPVHKTEVIKNTLNPVWKPMVVPLRILCGGDYERMIKIECYDYDNDGGHDLIGECYTTMKKLNSGPGHENQYDLINPKKKAKKSNYKNSGTLVLNTMAIHVEPSFLDYIRGGKQLHFTVAVDFTASNGDPHLPGSLHFREQGDNQYSLAIKAVGEIVQDYDSDKMFPALGFGARIPPDWQCSHEFFLNGKPESPYCQGVHGILEAYHHALQTVQLYGPTNFAPVIRHVSRFASSYQDGNNYFILLIITDGIITDMPDTRKALVEASSLPMSVIIVGVGNEDFSAMELLDGDEKRLSFGGRYAERDIVQFVELRRHLRHGMGNSHYSQARLAKDVLAEIPQQVVKWMRTRGYSPKEPKSVSS
ncbi:copine-8-like isoform X2 [Oratosquilla oratoria]|uniref:copine-8-like isoform X2 n=1 Tax=Oratosquilla oratoria TaxID=337810 RepID=UPI003F76EC7B